MPQGDVSNRPNSEILNSLYCERRKSGKSSHLRNCQIFCQSANCRDFRTHLHWLVLFWGNLSLCLSVWGCEGSTQSHLCRPALLSLFFLLMSAYFTSASYINRPVYPLAPTSALSFPYSFIPNWKRFPNNQFPCRIWSSLRPNHLQSEFWFVLSFFLFFFPSHFLLFWSCSPPSCLSLLLLPWSYG